MERKMKQQAKKYGQEAIRSELKQELDGPVPTEGFQRSIVLKGEGNTSKPQQKDPLKSLLKAMGVKKSTGRINNAVITKDGTTDKFDVRNGRPKRRREIGESPEDFTLHAR